MEADKVKVVRVELKEANDFIGDNHRHHKPVQGHRFSVGCADHMGTLCGVATVGRPVARAVDQKFTCEVTRLCTDGTKNACSFLYGLCARIAKEMGFTKIQTYILESESGASLIASGWDMEATVVGRQWEYTGGKKRRTDQPTCNKTRWSKAL